jgi:hypothetical protein
MKKIKVKIINTRDREGSLPAGAVLDMPELTARVWIRQGLAIELQEPATAREYAIRQASENAMIQGSHDRYDSTWLLRTEESEKIRKSAQESNCSQNCKASKP